jgi:hypothetical protein
MKRTRMPHILLPVLLASAAVWAAPAADQRSGAAPVVVSGVYLVTFNVQVGSVPAAGGTIFCRAKIAPNLPGFDNRSQGLVPVESARGMVTFIGSSANCTVEIPFSWTVVDTETGVVMSYEIDALSGPGVAAVHTQQGVGLAYPRMGGAASVRLNVAF